MKDCIKNINSPKDIKNKLDKYVIGQERAKNSICFAFYLHLLRCGKIKPQNPHLNGKDADNGMPLPNPDVLLIGDTGTGKTYMVEKICQILGLPMAKIDCSRLTESGYHGMDVHNAFTELYQLTCEEISEMEHAVIYFDEFDKLNESSGSKKTIGGVKVQQEFLTLIENSKVHFPLDFTRRSGLGVVDTSKIIYVFSGSFKGIESIINKRTVSTNVGFKKSLPKQEPDRNYLKNLQPKDLENYGIIAELISRINYIVCLDRLCENDIIMIMKESVDSELIKYKNFFKMHSDQLIIEENAYQLIAEKVVELGLGARGIRSILQEYLEQHLFESVNTVCETFTISTDDKDDLAILRNNSTE